MKHPAQRLQGELDQILALLDQGLIFSFTDEECRALKEEADRLSQKLSAIESGFLFIGLLGGTGVGKSTLMNALAGSDIASTSHRRPHTDRVLIYRHAEANPKLTKKLPDVPWREVTHDAEAIRQILLCDLPDFDSLMGEHCKHVLDFLEHLDILVWVTSPEKYADGRFYEFLQMVTKAKQNFYFVLNKADLLFQGEALQAGYEQMGSVTTRFNRHIRENGIPEPLLYTLSAEEARVPDRLAPWNQFPAFRQQIFQQRDIKQITAIKTGNLDFEVKGLLSTFEREVVNLESLDRILENSVKDLEKGRLPWGQAGQEAIELWLDNQIRPYILTRQAKPSHLVGPGHGLDVLLQEFQKRFTRERQVSSGHAHFEIPEETTAPFRRRVEWLEDRLNHRILRQNLPSPFRERLRQHLDTAKNLEDLKEGLSNVVALCLSETSSPPLRGFRARQLFTYLVLLALLLLAMGGEPAWRRILGDPGSSSILGLLLSGIDTLFSPKGLAALGSYALLNLFFAFHFYRRYKRLLNRTVQKTTDSLKAGLVKVWEEKFNALLEDLRQFRAGIRAQISTISDLKQGRRIK